MSNGDYGESIPEEYVEESEETEGEWIGCTKRFLAPISTTSRGSGERMMDEKSFVSPMHSTPH
jgi:hypothetical protein